MKVKVGHGPAWCLFMAQLESSAVLREDLTKHRWVLEDKRGPIALRQWPRGGEDPFWRQFKMIYSGQGKQKRPRKRDSGCSPCCRWVAQSHPAVVTPRTVACQAPLSMGFPRQDHWSGLPLPPPGNLPDSGIEPGSPALQADFFFFFFFFFFFTTEPLPSQSKLIQVPLTAHEEGV